MECERSDKKKKKKRSFEILCDAAHAPTSLGGMPLHALLESEPGSVAMGPLLHRKPQDKDLTFSHELSCFGMTMVSLDAVTFFPTSCCDLCMSANAQRKSVTVATAI